MDKPVKKRQTYVFIDASNIIYGCRRAGWKVDYQKLFKWLKEKYQARRVFYYAGEEKGNVKQAEFLKVIESFGYELKVKPVKLFVKKTGGVTKKANCDVDLTFDAMRYLGSYSRGIFLTGDGDFTVLLEWLKKRGKGVVIIAHPSSTARDLRQLVGEKYVDLSSLKIRLEYKKRRETHK